MRYGLMLLLLLAFKPVYSQDKPVNTDSLRKVIRDGNTYEEQINASKKLVENFQMKNFDSTLVEGNNALALARKHADSTSVAELKRQIGVASYFKGEYDVAASNFYASIAILEKNKDVKKLAPVYNDLAKLYRKTRALDRALDNYNKAATIYRDLRDTAGIAMILNESGVVFEYREDYREALNRYIASMQLAERTGDSLSVSYSLSNIAGVYVIQRKFDLAEQNLLRALHIRQLLKDSFAIALTYSDLGVAMNNKGDYSKAIAYLTLSNKAAESLKYPELQSNNYNELSMVAQKQGDYQQAFQYFLKRSALRDSLYAIEKTRQIEELNSKYESAKKEQQIAEQQHRLNMQNYLLAGAGLFILLAGLLVHSRVKRAQLRKETEIQQQLMLQQQLAAKAVMEAEENERERIARDLHDGVGQMMSAAKMNLSAFESEIPFSSTEQRESFEKIIHLVDESCREVRTVSHLMMPNALLKNNLGAAIRDFADKLSQKKLQVNFYTEGLEERFDSNIETVLYRVVQECVNNAIKHAGASRLDISLIRDKEGISGTIEDNGKGFDSTDKEKSEGIGLRNITTRIEYLKGTLDIDSSPGKGTLVALFVPLPQA